MSVKSIVLAMFLGAVFTHVMSDGAQATSEEGIKLFQKQDVRDAEPGDAMRRLPLDGLPGEE